MTLRRARKKSVPLLTNVNALAVEHNLSVHQVEVLTAIEWGRRFGMDASTIKALSYYGGIRQWGKYRQIARIG